MTQMLPRDWIADKDVIDACLRQDIAALRQYARWGVNFNKIRDENGEPLLHLAILANKVNSFNTLVSFGLDLDIKNKKEGASALNLAATTNKIQFVKILLEKGADVNSRADDGFTPLNNAVLYKHFNVVNTLLSSSMLDVNIPTHKKTPAIYYAFYYQRMDIVKAIIKHHSFDLNFHLALLNDSSAYRIKEHLMTFASDEQKAFIDAFQKAKVFGLKYDLSTCLQYKNLNMHEFACFRLEGYANRLGAKAMWDSFQNFYHTIVQELPLPDWALNTFVHVNEALAFSASVFEASAYMNKIERAEVVLIPSGWERHTIAFVIHDNMLYRCNRGHLSDDIHGVEEFVITKPHNLNVQIIEHMLNAQGTSQYLQEDIINILGLQKVGDIENPPQLVGNCVWTSLEAGLEAALVANFVDEGLNRPLAHELAKQSFLVWENFDLNHTLKDLVDNPAFFKNEEIYDDLIINALKAHHDPKNEGDIKRGVVILEELSDPFVLETFYNEIGRDVLKYAPLSYQTISYMQPFHNITPQNDVPFSARKLAEVKEYYQFLKTCDNYRQQVGDVLKISDILSVSNTSPLQKIFEVFMPSQAKELEPQGSLIFDQILSGLMPEPEPALYVI